MRNVETIAVVVAGLAVACGSPASKGANAPTVTCPDGNTCFEQGAKYFVGAEPAPGVQADDLRRAARYFERSCELGYQRGCNAIGNLFRQGIGVPRDLVTARSFYVRACADHETTPEACFNLFRVERELEGP